MAPGQSEGQVSLAVSCDERHWFLINASPDLRQQILATPALWPDPQQLRHSPIAGVILTNAEVDAVAGLLSMREGAAFSIYAHERVLDVLNANPIFNVLDRALVHRLPITLGLPFEPILPDGTASGLRIEAFAVPGKVAWHLEGAAVPDDGDTLGLTIRAGGSVAHIVTACAALTPALNDRLRGADLVFFDGTLWRDDEMITAGLGHKTGQRMGHMSMSGAEGSVKRLGDLGIRQKVFVHINNSNPVLLPHSAERHQVEAAGWIIPSAGREFTA